MTHAKAPTADIYLDLRERAQKRHAAARPVNGQVREAEFEIIDRGRRRKSWTIGLDAFSLDGVYAFLLGAAMLFVQEAGSAAGAAMAVLPLLYMALRRRMAGRVLTTRWVLFLFPAVALMSVVWSEDPKVSLKYALELWLTFAAAVGLASSRQPEAVLKGICLAFTLYVGASLGFGRFTALGASDQAFLGLGDGKNMMADIGATGALLGAAVMMVAARQRSLLWGMVGLMAFAMDAYVVILARSAGATLAMAVAFFALLVLTAMSALSRAVRWWSAILVVISAGIVVGVVRQIGSLLIGISAQLFDKDATLTGRTYLWYRANDLIAEKTWLGHGFNAFWRQGNTDAEGLWRYAGIVGRSGFNFHNTLIELAVQLGLVGAAVWCLLALIGAGALIRRFIERPTLTTCFWLAYLVYAAVRTPVEAIGYAAFYYSTVLMVGAVAFGLEPLPRRLKAHAPYRPQSVRLAAVREAREAWRDQRARPRAAAMAG